MSATREAIPSLTVRRAGVATVVAVVAAAYLAFIGVRLAVFDGDPSGFVTAGALTTDPTASPDSLVVTPGTAGYDGQAYYRLARDPFTDEVAAEGITFTRPAYWQSRIGYPLVAWVVSAGGQEFAVPLALLMVNLLAVVLLALLAARLARSVGRSAWWGAVPAAWAGYVVGVGQDLTEPLAGVLLLAALCWMRADRNVPAALTLTAAALTRETTLVLAVAVLAAAVAVRVSTRASSRRRPPWWVGAVPLIVYAGWRTWVRARWSDEVPGPPSDNPLGPPLTALLQHLGFAMNHLGTQWPNLVLLLPTVAALVVAATALLQRGGPLHERAALLGYLAVLLCLPVWDRGQAYLRWGCEPALLGWIILVGRAPARPGDAARPVGRDDRALVALTVLSVVVWLVAATQSVGYPRHEGVWSGAWTWS